MSENSQSNPTLHELETQLEEILEELDSEDSAIKEKAEESISQIILEIENKLDGYIAVINTMLYPQVSEARLRETFSLISLGMV